MDYDESRIEVSIYVKTGGIYLAKVTFQGIGLYINSFTIRDSPKFPEKGLWVQEPKFNVNGKFKSPVEFNKNGKLWKLIERKCRDAVENYQPPDVTVGDLDTDINLNNIPL